MQSNFIYIINLIIVFLLKINNNNNNDITHMINITFIYSFFLTYDKEKKYFICLEIYEIKYYFFYTLLKSVFNL